MSLLPPAFKDPAFAPLGRPIRRLTVADARKHQSRMQRFAAIEEFECENHGNADTGCLQEPCMPPTGKEVLRRGEIGQLAGRINFVTSEYAKELLKDAKQFAEEMCGIPSYAYGGEPTTKESVGRMITDLGRRALAEGASSYSNKGEIGRLVPGVLGPHEMLDADVAHMRENRQITASALLRAGQKLDANLTPPSPELTTALNAAQAALAEHLFGEAKKVKDPFEKAAAKLRAKDVERAAQMRKKADALWVACGAPLALPF